MSCLKGRRTVALYEPELPDRAAAALLRAVDGARYAPNHRKTEPWLFHELGPSTRTRVLDLGRTILVEKHGEAKALKKWRRWADVPGWLVVTAATSAGDPMREREDYAASCCATHSLMLSLFDDGFGTKWSSFGTEAREAADFAELVGFDARERQAVGTIWWGLPRGAKFPKPPQKALGVNDVLLRTP